MVSQAPVPVRQVDGTGSLYARGSVDDRGDRFDLLIDTGSVFSARAAETAHVGQHTLRLFDQPTCGGAAVARAVFENVEVLDTPLGAVGAGDHLHPIGGVLGGDLLRQFSLKLHYGAAPTISLLPPEIACSCALADGCQVVLPFTLGGGGTLVVENQVYTYPPTRVTVDACLEPVRDPVARGVSCVREDRTRLSRGYETDGAPGVSVRLLVATGFPGLLLGASAYDRMCRADRAPQHARLCRGGTSAQVFAAAEKDPGGTVYLHFANPGGTTRAVPITLGDACSVDELGQPLAALVIVGREGILAACGELARSRRLRAEPPSRDACDNDCHPNIAKGEGCSSHCREDASVGVGKVSCMQRLSMNGNEMCGEPDRCTDCNQPAAGFLEFDAPLPVYLVPDAAPILQEANFDVRPALSDIEGVVGSELLGRLEARIDYPNRRIIAQCGCQTGCTAYPRYACPSGATDCGPHGKDKEKLCNPPSAIPVRGGPLCLGAPADPLADRDAGVTASLECAPAPACDGGAPRADGGPPARPDLSFAPAACDGGP